MEGEEERKEENDDDITQKEKKGMNDCGTKRAQEVKINIQKKNIQLAQSVDIWPRRTKTDITEIYLF